MVSLEGLQDFLDQEGAPLVAHRYLGLCTTLANAVRYTPFSKKELKVLILYGVLVAPRFLRRHQWFVSLAQIVLLNEQEASFRAFLSSHERDNILALNEQAMPPHLAPLFHK